MPSADDIASQIRATLAVTDPDLDTTVGSTTRRIIDAVAESIGESYLDQHLMSYVYDVDSKSGGDLDTFTQTIGGISRLAAKRATGLVTFTRGGAADRVVLIPVNTQIASSVDPSVVVQTMTGGTMNVGDLSVTVPVQAVITGPQGNAGANTITQLLSTIDGTSTVTNLQPLSGGTYQESDAELRLRWKQTAFRSNAGTESMYLALALADADCPAAVVIGSSSRWREQVQITSGTATSQVPDAAYIFRTGVAVGPDIDNGYMLINGVDYVWNNTVIPPTLTFNVTQYTAPDGSTQPIEGAVLDLDFEYTSTTSRNDPLGSRFTAGAIMNRVDVWAAGVRPKTAQQSVVFSSGTLFSSTSTSNYLNTKFQRPDGTNPVVGNVFIPLSFGPIVSLPDVLTVAGVTYGRIGSTAGGSATKPAAFSWVNQTDAFGLTSRSLCGIEWVASQVPANGAVFTVGTNQSYVYNQIPASVQQQVDRWRLAGTDAKVHAAKQVLMRLNIAVMYDRGANQASVNAAMNAAVSDYLTRAGLGGTAQVSDLLNVIHNVPGVDNVRALTGQDYASWSYASRNSFGTGLQRVINGAVATTYVSTLGTTRDVTFSRDSYPVLESIVIKVKAQNTFAQ